MKITKDSPIQHGRGEEIENIKITGPFIAIESSATDAKFAIKTRFLAYYNYRGELLFDIEL